VVSGSDGFRKSPGPHAGGDVTEQTNTNDYVGFAEEFKLSAQWHSIDAREDDYTNKLIAVG